MDGVLADLADPIRTNAKIEFINREDPRALELIRHDCAHVLAEAVQALFPGTQVTIGPVIENGFYYDFYRETAVHAGGFRRHRKEDARDHRAATRRSRRRYGRATRPTHFFEKKGEAFKVELVDAIPEDQDAEDLQAGRMARPVPRPAHDVDGQGRHAPSS